VSLTKFSKNLCKVTFIVRYAKLIDTRNWERCSNNALYCAQCAAALLAFSRCQLISRVFSAPIPSLYSGYLVNFTRYRNLNTFQRICEWNWNPQNESIKFAICPALIDRPTAETSGRWRIWDERCRPYTSWHSDAVRAARKKLCVIFVRTHMQTKTLCTLKHWYKGDSKIAKKGENWKSNKINIAIFLGENWYFNKLIYNMLSVIN